MEKCPWCLGDRHDGRCPDMEVIEFYPDGMVKRVEFKKKEGRLSGKPIERTDAIAKDRLPDRHIDARDITGRA